MATMTFTSSYVEFGPCQVTFNAYDLGSFKGGVTFRYSYTIVKSKPTQLATANQGWITGEEAIVTVPMIETNITMLQYVMPSGTYSTSGSKHKIVVGGGQLTTSDQHQLIITPTTDGSGTLDSDANNKITVHKAMCMGPIEKQYNMESERTTSLQFDGFADTTRTANDQLFAMGDISF